MRVKNIRLKHYDYKSNGYYFVTICTDYKKPYLEISGVKDIVVAELARLNEKTCQPMSAESKQRQASLATTGKVVAA